MQAGFELAVTTSNTVALALSTRCLPAFALKVLNCAHPQAFTFATICTVPPEILNCPILAQHQLPQPEYF